MGHPFQSSLLYLSSVLIKASPKDQMNPGPTLMAMAHVVYFISASRPFATGWDAGTQFRRRIALFSLSQVSIRSHQGTADDSVTHRTAFS